MKIIGDANTKAKTIPYHHHVHKHCRNERTEEAISCYTVCGVCWWMLVSEWEGLPRDSILLCSWSPGIQSAKTWQWFSVFIYCKEAVEGLPCQSPISLVRGVFRRLSSIALGCWSAMILLRLLEKAQHNSRDNHRPLRQDITQCRDTQIISLPFTVLGSLCKYYYNSRIL